MLETLYKVKAPDEMPVEQAEYYELFIDSKPVNGKVVYFVREHHGWWDEANKRNVNNWQTYGPDEGYTNFEEALERYKLQRTNRAKSGYVHSLSPDFLRNVGTDGTFPGFRKQLCHKTDAVLRAIWHRLFGAASFLWDERSQG